MKLCPIFQTILLVGTGFTFSPVLAFRIVPTTFRRDISLHISSWGTRDNSRSLTEEGGSSPERNIQGYLKPPEAVEARDNIDGKVLVSGLVNSKDRADQVMFDLLNNEESAFEFEKIIAFVDDVPFAKKRLLSRSARYSGLLDKLDFVEAASTGDFPSSSQLEGVKSWVAVLDGHDLVSKVNQVTGIIENTNDLQNVAILAENASQLDSSDEKQIVESLEVCGAKFTFVAVGPLQDIPEGAYPYRFYEMGKSEAKAAHNEAFSRDEAMRMITECLQLEAGVNRALHFSMVADVNATEAKLIKGLREAGYARPQEVDHMLRDGVKHYEAAIADFLKKNPDFEKGYTSDVWWEDEKFQKSVRKSSHRAAEENQKVKDATVAEIEKIASEWAKREYFRQMMAGTIDANMTEDDFIASVWERAMFEGDLVYRQMNGEATDADKELEDFKTKQERKKQAMLKKAKSELKEILEEENLGGDDLNQKLDKVDASPEGIN